MKKKKIQSDVKTFFWILSFRLNVKHPGFPGRIVSHAHLQESKSSEAEQFEP